MTRAETRPTLRDCPFCHTDGKDDEKILFIGSLMICHDVEYVGGYSVRCTGCGVELHDEYRDDLADRWNGVVRTTEEFPASDEVAA